MLIVFGRQDRESGGCVFSVSMVLYPRVVAGTAVLEENLVFLSSNFDDPAVIPTFDVELTHPALRFERGGAVDPNCA